jgi:DNA-binding XRE family transcriptional regulator
MSTIRELRQEKGWTQFDLAIEVGVHPQAVYLWESGRRTPLVPQMRKLGQLFGMCSDDIALEPRPDTIRSRHRSSSSDPGEKRDAPDTEIV